MHEYEKAVQKQIDLCCNTVMKKLPSEVKKMVVNL